MCRHSNNIIITSNGADLSEYMQSRSLGLTLNFSLSGGGVVAEVVRPRNKSRDQPGLAFTYNYHALPFYLVLQV